MKREEGLCVLSHDSSWNEKNVSLWPWGSTYFALPWSSNYNLRTSPEPNSIVTLPGVYSNRKETLQSASTAVSQEEPWRQICLPMTNDTKGLRLGPNSKFSCSPPTPHISHWSEYSSENQLRSPSAPLSTPPHTHTLTHSLGHAYP